MTHPWTDPQWLSEAHGWIETELGRLGRVCVGDIQQPHVETWSTVLRVPTDVGDVWFKANQTELRHEAALVEVLAQRRPDCVPPLLAADTQRGWMLMADAGERLRSVVAVEQSLDRWLDVLPLYADLQVEMADSVDGLLALGVPDMRLATLPARYADLLDDLDADARFRDALPAVRRLCDQLADFGIAETIQHDDLHDGQVFVRNGLPRVLDWGDACVSHPFFTLSVTLEGVISWGLDDIADSVDIGPFRAAYLKPYSHVYPKADLVAACELALRLGWVCRAVNGHVVGDDDQTRTRLRMFLDGTP